MSSKKDEIIFGAKRAGVTLLHSFTNRAELDSAREKAMRLGTTLSQLLYGAFPRDPENAPPRFTVDHRFSPSGLKIQITECDEFTRKCLERQAAYHGMSVEEYIIHAVMCEPNLPSSRRLWIQKLEKWSGNLGISESMSAAT
jgi:hypothetical protein